MGQITRFGLNALGANQGPYAMPNNQNTSSYPNANGGTTVVVNSGGRRGNRGQRQGLITGLLTLGANAATKGSNSGPNQPQQQPQQQQQQYYNGPPPQQQQYSQQYPPQQYQQQPPQYQYREQQQSSYHPQQDYYRESTPPLSRDYKDQGVALGGKY